jgi:hypothetical protein
MAWLRLGSSKRCCFWHCAGQDMCVVLKRMSVAVSCCQHWQHSCYAALLTPWHSMCRQHVVCSRVWYVQLVADCSWVDGGCQQTLSAGTLAAMPCTGAKLQMLRLGLQGQLRQCHALVQSCRCCVMQLAVDLGTSAAGHAVGG